MYTRVCDPLPVGEHKKGRETQWQPDTIPTQPQQSLLLIAPNSVRRVRSILFKQRCIAACGARQLRMQFVTADSLAAASGETSSSLNRIWMRFLHPWTLSLFTHR